MIAPRRDSRHRCRIRVADDPIRPPGKSHPLGITPVVDGEFRGSHGDAMARLGHAVANGDGTTTVSNFTYGR